MQSKKFCSQLFSSLLKALAICVLVQLAAAQSYNIVDLGVLPGAFTSEGQGINKCGHVTGISQFADDSHGFFWSEHGGMRDLGTLPGGFFSVAQGINASGDVAGYADLDNGNEIHAVLWVQGKIHDLGTLPGGYMSAAYGINDGGEIAGGSDGDAVLWDKHGLAHDLGTLPGASYSQAIAINQHGKIAGVSDNRAGENRAISWTKCAGMRDLGTLPGGGGSSAGGINNLGQIVGGSDGVIHGHYYITRAVLWSPNNKAEDLGGTHGSTDSGAIAINDRGQIVGSAWVGARGAKVVDSSGAWVAFVWTREKGMQNLNDLIPRNSGWFLATANSINNGGQITGGGTINGESHAFLLTPVSAPYSPSGPD